MRACHGGPQDRHGGSPVSPIATASARRPEVAAASAWRMVRRYDRPGSWPSALLIRRRPRRQWTWSTARKSNKKRRAFDPPQLRVFYRRTYSRARLRCRRRRRWRGGRAGVGCQDHGTIRAGLRRGRRRRGGCARSNVRCRLRRPLGRGEVDRRASPEQSAKRIPGPG